MPPYSINIIPFYNDMLQELATRPEKYGFSCPLSAVNYIRDALRYSIMRQRGDGARLVEDIREVLRVYPPK